MTGAVCWPKWRDAYNAWAAAGYVARRTAAIKAAGRAAIERMYPAGDDEALRRALDAEADAALERARLAHLWTAAPKGRA